MRTDNDPMVALAGILASAGETSDPPPRPNGAVRFDDLVFVTRGDSFGGERAMAQYPNGYAASVIRGPYTYGGPEGLYELAVLDGDGCCYDTPITDDVEGRLTTAMVTKLLRRIAALPPAKNPRKPVQ